MADDRHYVPGEYFQICDFTGFKIRNSRTKKVWTGMQVREQSWEARNAQDFVRGVVDDQTVAIPRPRQTNVFVSEPAYWDAPSQFWDQGAQTDAQAISIPNASISWDIGYGGQQ